MTDSDKTWGPFTIGPWKNTFEVEFDSGDDEDPGNRFYLICFGWALRIRLPEIVSPHQEKHFALTWSEEDIKRLGRNWYYETYSRRFGISLSNMGSGYDFLQIRYGQSTNDSSTDKTWSYSLPWMQWDHVRHSLYAPDGSHFYTEPRNAGRLDSKDKACWEMKDSCPASYFGFEDYDGEMIVATCVIEEMEWHKGDGWFKWLKYFSRPKIRRSLDLKFSAETGPEKGSWKGGTIGTAIGMQKGETPEMAFRRYCGMEHRARHDRKFRIRFIGPCNPPAKKEGASV
jgi:hypothetical protein